VQAGPAANVRVPDGATRMSLAVPMLIDTHVHLSPTRELLTRDLQRRAYFGVSAALSLGTDNYELLDMRKETIPGAARFFSAGRGILVAAKSEGLGMPSPRAPACRAEKTVDSFNYSAACRILVASTAAPAEHPFRFMVLAISSPRSGVRG
jgi:hypothetical protein